MTRGRFTIRLIAGGYLGYIGITLIRDALAERPENYVWYSLAGALFAVIGFGWLLTGIRAYMKERASEAQAEEEIETAEDGKNIEETDTEKEE